MIHKLSRSLSSFQFLIPLLIAIIAVPVLAQSDMDQIEKQFGELPLKARRLTGPLFWLHGDESQELLKKYVGKVAEGGNGSFTTESRPHVDWLGKGWFRDVGICLDAAKQHGLHLWIFDEKWWPSQSVAGKVPPRYAAKQLEASSIEVVGPRSLESQGYSGDRYIAAVAGRVGTEGAVDGDSLVDLAPFVKDGHLSWSVPDGHWMIMKFTYGQAPGLGQGGGTQLSVDGMSKDCVDWYLQTVYQPHLDRFRDDFGKTIVGFFYDEPETRGDWGTELNGVLEELGVDWKKAYVAYKFRLVGEAQAAARYQYLDARAETWGRTMYGGITHWCQQYGVKSIGHFMEHAGMYKLPDFCAGDLMRVQKYSSMGGIDAVFSQFKMGQRAAYDAPCWQTPKLGSSITHAYGKPDDVTMCEIFGARGQDLTYPEMKWWADHMQVSGVNFLIPHSFNPRSPRDTDCPPYFYDNGFEPRWPLYRVFATYNCRLSLMLTGGRHVAPVALLSPGQSLHVGLGVSLEQISESLQDALYDCDWIPYEVFENDMKLVDKTLGLRQESYRVLVVPPVEVIPYATLAKAKQFFEQGGTVIAHGFLPTKSATIGKSSADIAPLADALWGSARPSWHACKTNSAGGRTYFLPEDPSPEQLQTVLAQDAQIHPTLEVMEGRTDHWLHVLHRVKAGRDIFFITNQNSDQRPRQFHFRATAKGVPECWDAMRNEITSVPFTRHGATVDLSLTLAPNESVLLVFQPAKRELPLRRDFDQSVASHTITIHREDIAPPPEPQLELNTPWAKYFADASWVWYPGAHAAQQAPAGTRYFRKQVTLPAGRHITRAVFAGTADNSFTLFVNGQPAGKSDSSSEGWRNPVALDVQKFLQPGENQLAIEAVNATNQPNPAGLLGVLRVEFDKGKPLMVAVDASWKAGRDKQPNWMAADFDDSAWVAAQVVAPFGGGVWGRLGGERVTLSPVKADPFTGQCELPADVDLNKARVYLQLEGVAPETAARVTINDSDAGGVIGQPLRLEVSRYLKAGTNKIHIEPFAPRTAKLIVYP